MYQYDQDGDYIDSTTRLTGRVVEERKAAISIQNEKEVHISRNICNKADLLCLWELV